MNAWASFVSLHQKKSIDFSISPQKQSHNGRDNRMAINLCRIDNTGDPPAFRITNPRCRSLTLVASADTGSER